MSITRTPILDRKEREISIWVSSRKVEKRRKKKSKDKQMKMLLEEWSESCTTELCVMNFKICKVYFDGTQVQAVEESLVELHGTNSSTTRKMEE